MNNKFRGWTTVFNFTFRQSTKGAGFKAVTTLIALVIIGAFILINIFVAKPEEAQKPSDVQAVFVLDNSGLQPMNLKDLNPQFFEDRYKNIEFINESGKSREAVIQNASVYGPHAIVIIIEAGDSGFELETVIPNGSVISRSEASELIPLMTTAFEANKLMQSGLSSEQLNIMLKPVMTSFAKIGENTSIIATVVKMIAPMIFGLVLYMMLLLYGQNISKSISTEKTSKLMETLLTSIHPYALIAGKVLAISSMAVLQFVSWILAAVVGLYGGNAIASAIYPEHQNSALQIIDYLKDNIGETAMSLPAVVLAILIFCVGFLFYCVLAGLAGSMVSKPEEASNTQGLFVFPIVISWAFSYFAPIAGSEGTLTIIRLVPFTIPFTVPADLLTGSMGLGQGLLSLAVLLVFSLLVIMLSARLYKGLVLYTGQKLSLKTLGNILRAKAD